MFELLLVVIAVLVGWATLARFAWWSRICSTCLRALDAAGVTGEVPPCGHDEP